MERERLLELLRCPACHGTLADGADALRCAACGRSYPIAHGIPCFSEPDTFYDEYAEVHCPFTPTPKGMRAALLKALPFWSYREWRFWRDAIPGTGRLLDLGSGRGKEIFMERARETVGLDGSLAFLRGCTEHYDAAVLSGMPPLPFADGSFDAVVSSHVLGHIPVELKDPLLAEIHRVLRPGGVTAHIIETDSRHPSITAAKRDPTLYRRYLVDQDGHVGLEYASAVVERFARAGFRLRLRRVVDALTPSPMYYHKHLDHPEFGALPGVAWTRALSRLNRTTRAGNLAFEFGFGAFHRTVEQWMGEPDHANFIHVAFERS